MGVASHQNRLHRIRLRDYAASYADISTIETRESAVVEVGNLKDSLLGHITARPMQGEVDNGISLVTTMPIVVPNSLPLQTKSRQAVTPTPFPPAISLPTRNQWSKQQNQIIDYRPHSMVVVQKASKKNG